MKVEFQGFFFEFQIFFVQWRQPVKGILYLVVL